MDQRGRIRLEDADADAEARVIQVLRALGMAPDDAATLVAAEDPVVVHRYIELHGELLAELLADQLQMLDRLERTLNDAIVDRRSASLSSGWSSHELSDGTQ
jgi:hypothetical protein